MTSTINIQSGDGLKEWLEAHAGDQMAPWARLLAQRAALRVFPLVLQITTTKNVATHQMQALTLLTLRTNMISSAAGILPSDDMAIAILAASNSVLSALNLRSKRIVFSTVAAFPARAALFALPAGFHNGAAPAAADAADAAADAAGAAAGAALSADCQMLMQSGAGALKNAPLWIRFDDTDDGNPVTVTPPKEIIKWMDHLPLLTDILGPNAGLIDAWYQPLFAGQPPRFNEERARDFFIKNTGDDFWKITDERTGEDIMNDIAAGLGWPEADIISDNFDDGYGDGEKAEDVGIAPQKPATLEPEWSDRRLILSARPLADDFKEGDMNDALQALKTVLEGFSSDVSGSNNIDQRIVRYLSDLAHSAPVQVPDQAEFFVFAHNETVLSGLVPTAEREWDGLLAAHLAAISLQFADTVRKFPAWRAFRRSVPDDDISPEDVAAAKDVSHVLAEALREDFATEFVDGIILNTLDDIADDIPDVQPVAADDRLVTEQTREQTHDLLESINNILKPIMAGALWVKGKAGELGADTWERLSKGIRAEYGDQTEKLGRQVVKLGFGLLRYGVPMGGAAAFGGKPLVVWLLSAFPSYFKWLEPVAKILGVIG